MAHCRGKQARNQEAAGGSTTPTWCRFSPHEYVAIYMLQDCLAIRGSFHKTLSSTRMITHSGTECYHINENARVVNDLDIIIVL